MSAAQAQAPAQPKDYTAHVVGYAHIDMAWLWRWEESIHDIMFNTFSNQLKLMDQHPDFTFAQDKAVVDLREAFAALSAKAISDNRSLASNGE